MAIPAESKKGFYLILGAIAALYIGSLVIKRLPG